MQLLGVDPEAFLRHPEIQEAHRGMRFCVCRQADRVVIRAAAQLQGVIFANPHPECAHNLVDVAILDRAPASDLLAGVSGRAAETITPGARKSTSTTLRVRARPR